MKELKMANFKSINDFLNRVNPKDMNKLQLEGLVKAGAFDNINKIDNHFLIQYQTLFLKLKICLKIKTANQIDLFSEDETIRK